MYRVVGCSSCHHLWILEPGGEEAACPRCRRRHKVKRLRPLFESESADAAREARSQLLADRAGVNGDMAGFTELEGVGTPNRPAPLESSGGSQGDLQTRIEQAIEQADPPTRDVIVERAGATGVPAERVDELLARMKRAGAFTEKEGIYRLL